MNERIQKIVKLITYRAKRGAHVSFSDINFDFDTNCPNMKIPGKGYKNITIDEYAKSKKIFRNLLKTNLLKNLPSGSMCTDYSKGTYTGNFGEDCYYLYWSEQ